MAANLSIQMLGLNSVLKGQDVTNGLVPPPLGTPPFTINKTETPPFAAGTYNPNYLEFPLATFSATPGDTPSDYTATIYWGDGSSSPGIIQYQALNAAPYAAPVSNTLAIYFPDKTYNNAGQYPVYVTVSNSAGKVLGTSKTFEETILPG